MNDTLVSCVMPTGDRRAFVPLAIECFLRQDHQRRELIVIDDGDDPVADLIPVHPAISYERVGGGMTLGAKRNLACSRASGEVIVHWDDDDWSAPWRISYQLRELRETGADLAGLRELYFRRPQDGGAWRYEYPAVSERPWVAGGTLCYPRSVWERHRFPELDVGEDTRFVWSARGLRIHAHADSRFYVATVHARNTSPKRPHGRRWRAVVAHDVEALMGADAAAYAAAAHGRAAVARATAQAEHVTISVPYHGCRAYVRECVVSLLAQTHEDLTVVVVNDGDPQPPWDVLADLDDPRLVRFDLTRNRGRYFADQVVLQATGSPYLMVHDADDWSERTLVASLLDRLRTGDSAFAVSAAYRHLPQRQVPQVVPGVRSATLSPLFEHRANQVGVFRADALRAIGGFYAGFTIGYDSFLTNALAMTGGIVHEPEPLYHWRSRPGSLTTAPETGGRSRQRFAARRELERMYRHAWSSFCRHRAGELGDEGLAGEIRALVDARVPAGVRAEIGAEAERLAALLRPGRAVPPPLPSSPWTITRRTAERLQERLDERPPRRILEVGSGVSTVVLARAGVPVVALEHDPAHAERTRALLTEHGLADAVDLRVGPLRPRLCPDGREHPWYDVELDGEFDFVFVDAPPLRDGRGAVLFALEDQLAPGWELWLNDAGRKHERECVERWERHIPLVAHVEPQDRGLAILHAAPDRSRRRAPSTHVLFWSSFDLPGRAFPAQDDAWIEDRARHWLAYTLPSILAQDREEFEYWLLCNPDGRERTEALASCVRDERVRLVYTDELRARTLALPRSERILATRLDSDDLYAPGVARQLAQSRERAEFFQFNRGYACDLRTGEVRHWPAHSSPFYSHSYGEELRGREHWNEPNHTTVRPRAHELDPGQFLVSLHGRNSSSAIRMGRGRLTGEEALAALRRFGLGAERTLDALAATARGNADWRGALRARAGLGPFEALAGALIDLAAARRVLDLRKQAADPSHSYDLVLHSGDPATVAGALAAVAPTGLVLLAGGPEPRGYCADRYPEAERLAPGARLLGRVIGLP